MTGEVPPRELLDLAQAFATEVTDRVGRIVPLTQRFTALAAGNDDAGRATVMALDPSADPTKRLRPQTIPLLVGGEPRLRLMIKFNCCWDRSKNYLTIDTSLFHVRLSDREKDEPLFRYEYVRAASAVIPAAHLQVHAHRDEFLYLMVTGDQGRPKVRARKNEIPTMSAFHFPLGGHRFRPCLEDILEALIFEFGIDRVSTWRSAIREGRESWRRLQLRAAVRDAPADAAAALEELGYECKPPASIPADVRERLTAF